MGCSSFERQTEISKKFCDEAEKLIHDPIFILAMKNTVVRLYPCKTIYCSEIFAPIFRSTLTALITIVLFAAFVAFLYYMCMGRFGGAAGPQIYLQQQPQYAGYMQPPPQLYFPQQSYPQLPQQPNGYGYPGQDFRNRRGLPMPSREYRIPVDDVD